MSDDLRIDLRPQPQDRKLKPDEQKIMGAAREFESLMIQQLMKSMRSTVHPTGLDSGSTMGTYQDMMDEQTARDLAHGRGLGLADAIAREFLGHAPGHDPARKHTDDGFEPPRQGNNS